MYRTTFSLWPSTGALALETSLPHPLIWNPEYVPDNYWGQVPVAYVGMYWVEKYNIKKVEGADLSTRVRRLAERCRHCSRQQSCISGTCRVLLVVYTAALLSRARIPPVKPHLDTPTALSQCDGTNWKRTSFGQRCSQKFVLGSCAKFKHLYSSYSISKVVQNLAWTVNIYER